MMTPTPPAVTPSQQDRAIARVLRPYTVLPPPAAWPALDRAPYHDALVDALAGLLRQYTTQALDTGRAFIDDDRRYAQYRTELFTARARIQHQLDGWLRFWGVTDAQGALTPAVRAALTEAPR